MTEHEGDRAFMSAIAGIAVYDPLTDNNEYSA